MKKWIALIAGTFLTFILSYMLIPSGFTTIINWIGPVFGTSIHIFLSMLYILLADPLTFTVLFVMWAAIGLAIGFIVRKKIGSAVVAFSVYSLMYVIMGLSLFGVFRIVQGLSTTLSNLNNPTAILTVIPPPPPGTTLTSILNAPVISDIFKIASEAMSGGLSDPSSIFSSLIPTIGFNMIKNLVIILVFGIVGGELGRRTEKMIRARRSGKLTYSSSAPIKMAATLLTIILLSGTIIAASVWVPSAKATSPFYMEMVDGFATPDGTEFLAAAFLDSNLNLNNVPISNPAYAGSTGAFLITMDINTTNPPPLLSNPQLMSQFLPLPESSIELISAAESYLTIVPSTLFVIVYEGVDSNTARVRGDQVAADFSARYGVDLQLLINLPMNMGSEGQSTSVLVYQSDDPLSTTGGYIAQTIPVARGGLAPIVKAAWDSGKYIPGQTSQSSNGTVMAAGYLIPSKFYPGNASGMPGMDSLFSSDTPVGFVGLLAYFQGVFHSSPQEHSLKIGDLVGYSGLMQFSQQSTISIMMIIVPNGTTVTGPISFEAKVVSSVDMEQIGEIMPQIFQFNMGSSSITFIAVPSGSVLNETESSVDFVYPFPIQLYVYKTVTPSSAGRNTILTVTITIVNNDTDVASNVVLNDTNTLFFYKTGKIDGSLQHSWNSIPGKSSVTHSYTISLPREGIYTLMPAVVTYTWNSDSFTALSGMSYAKISPPDPLTVSVEGVGYAYGYATQLVEFIPGFQGSGSLLVTLIIVAFLAIIALTEYRGYRKARKKIQKISTPAPTI